MTTIMRRTVRGAATGLGALAIVAGASSCGSLLGGGDEDGSEDPAGEEQPAEEGEDGAAAEDEGAEAAEDAADEGEEAADEETDGGSEESSEDSGSDAAAEDSVSDGGGDEMASGSLDEAALTSAGDKFFEFLQVMNEGDAEGTCAMMLDPTTDAPAEGAFLDACASGFESELGASFEPGSLDAVERSMIEVVDNGDGTVGVSAMGTEFPMSMVQADDGEWYVSV